MRFILTVILILCSLNLNAQVLRANPMYVSSINEPVPLGIQGTRTKTLIDITATSHTITLPTGIIPGEMIFVVFKCYAVPTITINTGISGAGWTLGTPVSNGTEGTLVYVYTIADGTDALTLTTDLSVRSAAISFRIASATTVYSASATLTGTNANPPSLTPAGGDAEYVWIAIAGARSAETITATPTDYNNLTVETTYISTGATIGTADRLYTGTVQDPSAFTTSLGYWVMFTIAIK